TLRTLACGARTTRRLPPRAAPPCRRRPPRADGSRRRTCETPSGERAAELTPRVEEARPHRGDRNLQRPGCLLGSETFELDEDERRALLGAHPGERALERLRSEERR